MASCRPVIRFVQPSTGQINFTTNGWTATPLLLGLGLDLDLQHGSENLITKLARFGFYMYIMVRA